MVRATSHRHRDRRQVDVTHARQLLESDGLFGQRWPTSPVGMIQDRVGAAELSFGEIERIRGMKIVDHPSKNRVFLKILCSRREHHTRIDQRAATQAIGHQCRDIGPQTQIEKPLVKAGDLSGRLIADAQMSGQLAEVRRKLARQILLATLEQTDLQIACLAGFFVDDCGAGKLGCRHRPAIAAADDQDVEGL